MSTFTTRHVGRIYVHILPHDRFRTKDFILRLHTPLTRETVTASALLPYLWMNGTTSYPSIRALTIATDELYGTVVRTSLGKRGGYHVFEVAASIPDVSALTDEDVVKRATDLAMTVLIDHDGTTGAFSPSSVKQELELHRRRIEASRDDKMSFALDRCLAEVAEGTSAALPRLGYLEDLKTLDNSVLYQAYQTVLQQSEVHAYLVGPYADPETLAEHILDTLGNALPGESVRGDMRVEPFAKTDKPVNHVRETQDVAQAQLDIGYRTGVNFADPLYPAMLMMNGVLGGFAHSKLFTNVREKHSLAYTVWSHLDSMTGVVAIMTGIDPAKYDQALTIINEQIESIQHGNITDSEINFTFRGLKNQYTVLLDQPSSLANWHYNGLLCGEQRDLQTLLSKLEKVTKADIVEASQQLRPHTIYFLTGEGKGE